jgi:hypothetical protein
MCAAEQLGDGNAAFHVESALDDSLAAVRS